MKSWMVGYGESALELSREMGFSMSNQNSKLFTPEIRTLLLDGEMVECSFVAFGESHQYCFCNWPILLFVQLAQNSFR